MCRAAYGAKDIYTRFAWESLEAYNALSARRTCRFYATGVLFFFPSMIPYASGQREDARGAQAPDPGDAALRWRSDSR